MTLTIQGNRYSLYNQDCLPFLKSLPDDYCNILTDPPYGIGRDMGFEGAQSFRGAGNKRIGRRQYAGGWDGERPGKEYFDELLRVGKNVLIFGGNHFADLLPVGNHWVVWDKAQTMPTFGDAELIYTNIPRQSVKWITREWNGLLGKEESREHPTQKPLKILKWLIAQYFQPMELVLDPFMGSGSTGVAAYELGYRFLGIEKDAKYFQIARRRLRSAREPLVIFDFSGEPCYIQTAFDESE